MIQEIGTTQQDVAPPPARMTFEEFLAWADEDTFAEWVDGEVTFLTTSNEHQILLKFLVLLLDQFVSAHDLGLVLFAPFLMKTGPDLPGREPDILFITKENLSRLRENYLDGPADLAVEIVSPESRGCDRETKFREYARGGVREYWLIDPPRKQAEFYQRSAEGVYEPLPVGADGIIRSVVLPGFWLDVEWLWQRPLPSLQSVLQRWEPG